VVKTASAVGVTAFAQDRDRTAIVTLIGRLRDPDAEVARDAAATLGTLPADAQAVAALGEVLLNADGYFHSVVRAAAAASLGTLKAPQSVEALIHATGDTMAEASEEAIKALGRLGDRRALPSLESIVRNQNGFFLEHIRRAAQESAARIAGTVAKA
jgi:HEAT repeat protein